MNLLEYPAFIVTSPPIPEYEYPTVRFTLPAVPLRDEPVTNLIAPEVSRLAIPVLSVIVPLIPDVPAFEVVMFMEPLELYEEYPDEILIPPPVELLLLVVAV